MQALINKIKETILAAIRKYGEEAYYDKPNEVIDISAWVEELERLDEDTIISVLKTLYTSNCHAEPFIQSVQGYFEDHKTAVFDWIENEMYGEPKRKPTKIQMMNIAELIRKH